MESASTKIPGHKSNWGFYGALIIIALVGLGYFFFSDFGLESIGGYMENQIQSRNEFQTLVAQEKKPVLLIFFNKDTPHMAVEVLSNAASKQYPKVKNYCINISDGILSRQEVDRYVGTTPLVCCTGKCNDQIRRISQPEPDERAFKELLSWLDSCTTMVPTGKESVR